MFLYSSILRAGILSYSAAGASAVTGAASAAGSVAAGLRADHSWAS